MNKAAKIIISAIIVLITLGFVLWLFYDAGDIGLLPAGFAAISCVLFGLILYFIAFRTEDFLKSPEIQRSGELSRLEYQTNRRHIALIIVFMLLSRAFILLLGYFASGKHLEDGLFTSMQEIWTKMTDANSYLGIAKNWYVTEGDPRFHIVFFPFYPIIIKLFWFATQNYFSAAVLVSNISAVAAAIIFYKIACMEADRRFALRSVKYMFIFPAAFFFALPMTESLFLLLTLLCVYFIRKKKFLLGCVFGALAAFTRSHGVLILAFILFEYIRELYTLKKQGSKDFTKTLLKNGFCMLIVPLGLLGYIYINYAVTGNPLQFMVYQKEHWYQQFIWFFDSVSRQVDYYLRTLASGSYAEVFGLWLPNIIAVFGSLLIALFAVRKKLRISYAAYFICYAAVTLGASFLISAPRYMSACFPLALAAAALTENKWADRIMTAVYFAGFVTYTVMFVSNYPIY